MSDAPKLPKGLPVESFDPGDLVYTAKDMEDFRAAGERDAAVAPMRVIAPPPRNVFRFLTSLGPLEFEVPPDSFKVTGDSIQYVGGDLSWTATESCTVTGLELELAGLPPVPIDLQAPSRPMGTGDSMTVVFDAAPPLRHVYEPITVGDYYDEDEWGPDAPAAGPNPVWPWPPTERA